MEYVLSLSYGKDSLACLGAIEQLGWPLDRIVHAEVWATDTIPADLPPMVEFKAKADMIIKERWGIEVEHIRSKWTFESRFYSKVSQRAKPEFRGRTMGWPLMLGSWCSRDLKTSKLIGGKGCVNYVGIAADEPHRFGQLSDKTVSPLVAVGWDEAYCRKWCEENSLLSPIYTSATRGGCWFCPKQPVHQLRLLRNNHPDLWRLMLKWDKDSFRPFHSDGHTVWDFERRFEFEEKHSAQKFKWEMIGRKIGVKTKRDRLYDGVDNGEYIVVDLPVTYCNYVAIDESLKIIKDKYVCIGTHNKNYLVKFLPVSAVITAVYHKQETYKFRKDVLNNAALLHNF